jgi:hypothetical protein
MSNVILEKDFNLGALDSFYCVCSLKKYQIKSPPLQYCCLRLIELSWKRFFCSW